jgi:hypothetical protein
MTSTRLSTHHHFTATLTGGVLGLSLPTCQPLEGHPSGRVVLDAAAALYHAERWLPALEEWLGQGLAPALASGASNPVWNQHLCLHNSSLNVQIHLPCSIFAHMKAPRPETLSAWVWQPVPCQLILDALPLSAVDLTQIEAGALIILPAAFAQPWCARLQATSSPNMLFAVECQESMGQLCVQPTGQLSPPLVSDHATVRFRLPLTFLPEQLLGLADGAPAQTPDTTALLATGAVALQTVTDQVEKILAVGQLIPVGSGFGLRVDERHNH